MRRPFRIAARLAAVYLVVAVPLVVIIALVYGQWYEARLSQIEVERTGRAEQAAVAFELLVRDMLRTLDSVGQSQAARAADSPGSAAELRRVEQLFPLAYVTFTDMNGRVLASSDPSLVGIDLSAEGALVQANTSSSGDGIEPSRRHPTGDVGFHLATRVTDPSGRIVGYAVALVDVSLLPNALEEVLIGRRGGVSIIDSDGQVVYQNEVPGLAASLTQWGDRYPWVQAALDGSVGHTRNWTFPVGDAGTRVAAFVPIPDLDWAAGSSIDRDVALAPLYRSLLIGLPLTTLVGVLALATSFALASRIRRSLTALSEDARRIGSGDLDQPVESERSDEIGDVARSLEEARRNLKREVEMTTDARDELRHERDHLEAALSERDAAHSSTRLLLEAASALSQWTDLDQVLERLAELLVRTLAHSRTWIFLWDDEHREIEVASSAGRSAFRKHVRIPYDDVSAPLREAIAERRSRVIDYDLLSEEQSRVAREFGMRYVLVVPLYHGPEFLGLIAVDDAGERREFTATEIDLAEGIGTQAAIAVENAVLFAEQRERAARLGALGDIGGLVSGSLRSEDVVRRALESVVKHRGVAATSIWGLDAKGERLELLGALGFPQAFFDDFADGIGVDEPYDAARAVRERSPVVHENARSSDISRRVLEAYGRYGIDLGSLAVVPLLSQDMVIGALTEAWTEARRFGADEIAFAVSLANTVGTAMLNARLHERTRDAARLGEALNRVDDVVHSTLRPTEMFDRMLQTAAEGLGCDSAALDLLEDGAWVPRYLWKLPERFIGKRLHAAQVPFAETAVRTKRPLAIDDAFNDPRTSREVQEEWGVRSVLVTPLARREEVIGAMFFNYHSLYRFSEPEVDFARKVASSVSLALENARLYENEHFVADTLQETLLALPDEIGGFDFAHAYHSASESARVGGDFYDVFELEPRCVGIMVGDISGKGVEAAMLTSLVKNTIRAQATNGERSPAQVMRVANTVTLKWSAPDIFSTVFFAIFHCDTGRLTYCNAGHTASVIVPGDDTRDLQILEANSPLVGAFPDIEFRDSETTLANNDILFMYTDGVTEARGIYGGLYEESRLFDVLMSLRGKTADATVEGVRDAVLAFGGGRLSDDLAILALERRDESG